MAEGKDSVEKSVRELEEEITCAICHSHFSEPKVLPCCHYYCKQCIHDLALRTGLDKPFSCPECRKDTTLPEGGVDNLQAAFFVNRMKNVYSKLERATGKVEAKCEVCSEDKAEAFCRQCAQFICAECVKQHRRMKKLFPGHKIVTLEELKEGCAKEVVVQEPTPMMCKLHKDPIKVYCFDCSSLICRDCTIKGHLGHNYEFITVAGPDMKEKLIQRVEPLRVTKENLLCAVKEIQTTKSDMKTHGISMADQIKKSFDELRQIIGHREQELLRESATEIGSKLEHLSDQEKSLSTASTMIQGVIEYTDQCVQHSTDADILYKHAELQNRIDQEIAEHQKMNLKPVEEVDMAVDVNCVKELKKLCQNKAKIGRSPIDPTRCTVTVGEAEINKASEAIVNVLLANGMPATQKCVIECDLKVLSRGATSGSKGKVDLIKGNEYRIRYTPTVRGRHELSVNLNGQKIAGSPFPVFVSIHPTQLGNPVRVITNVNPGPRDVAINSAGEIIVLGAESISVFSKDGKKLRSCDFSEQVSSTWGLALDKTDNSMYLTDYSDTGPNIIKINSDLKVCKTAYTKNGSGLMGIAVVGDSDEVLVCDSKQLEVSSFTKELKHVKQLDWPPLAYRKLSIDISGNFYVCSGKTIRVFDKDYKLLRSFGEDQLSCPYACVSSTSQHVYVADLNNHNVVVFTTEGKYVTSFGVKGSKEGYFNQPCGINIDNDGFVYVCDYCNKRVQVF